MAWFVLLLNFYLDLIGLNQAKWLVSCFDSVVEHSVGSDESTITFPSPLLSCLAEEEAGCSGNSCLINTRRITELSAASESQFTDMSLEEITPSSGFFLKNDSASSSPGANVTQPLSPACCFNPDIASNPTLPTSQYQAFASSPLSSVIEAPPGQYEIRLSDTCASSPSATVTNQSSTDMDGLFPDSSYSTPSPVSSFLRMHDEFFWLTSQPSPGVSGAIQHPDGRRDLV